jgi:hypothetical protein
MAAILTRLAGFASGEFKARRLPPLLCMPTALRDTLFRFALLCALTLTRAPLTWQIVIFGDDVILNHPIERWPVVVRPALTLAHTHARSRPE